MTDEKKAAGTSGPKKMPLMGLKVFDSQLHPGWEKKGIEDRPGYMRLWLAKDGVTSATQAQMRATLGDPNPFKPITSPDEIQCRDLD